MLAVMDNQVKLVLKQNTCIALSNILRMCAYCTYFCKIRNMQPLAGHRHQSFVFKYSKIITEFNSTVIERPRFCKSSKPYHFIHVPALERNGFDKPVSNRFL